MIFRDKKEEPELLLGNIKRYTSKKLQDAIEKSNVESRKEWMLWMMELAASRTSNVSKRML